MRPCCFSAAAPTWAPTAPAIRVLCLVGVLRALSFIVPPLLDGIGKPGLTLIYMLVAAVALAQEPEATEEEIAAKVAAAEADREDAVAELVEGRRRWPQGRRLQLGGRRADHRQSVGRSRRDRGTSRVVAAAGPGSKTRPSSRHRRANAAFSLKNP